MGKKGLWCVALAIATLAGTGCREQDERALGVERKEEPKPFAGEPGERAPDVVRPEKGATVAFSAATNSIAAARCAREERCKNVGAGQKFTTLDACMADVKKSHAEDLSAKECQGGLDQVQLDKCLQEVSKEDCKNPLDTIGRLTACRSSAICIATPAKP